jgi:hypothetical protein
MGGSKALVLSEGIEKKIYLIRGQKVILDTDLAELFGVETKRLNEQVKRNRLRFPDDFMFQLTQEEVRIWQGLRSQIATLKRGQHLKYLPFAFTEHGAIMAATVLNSPVAIEMSVFIVRAFIRLREMLAAHKRLAGKLAELEKKYDSQFRLVYEAINALMAEPEKPRRPIGFTAKEQRAAYGVKP